MAASVPLAGLSDSQPGIPEVRTLILEFQKCLAGGGPPGETSESAAAGDAPAASAGTEAADDAMEFAVGCALEEVDPQHAAAQEPAGKIRKGDFQCSCLMPLPLRAVGALSQEHAKAEMDRVHLCSNEADLTSALESRVFANTQRVVMIIDAQTSRVSVSANYLRLVRQESAESKTWFSDLALI